MNQKVKVTPKNGGGEYVLEHSVVSGYVGFYNVGGDQLQIHLIPGEGRWVLQFYSSDLGINKDYFSGEFLGDYSESENVSAEYELSLQGSDGGNIDPDVKKVVYRSEGKSDSLTDDSDQLEVNGGFLNVDVIDHGSDCLTVVESQKQGLNVKSYES